MFDNNSGDYYGGDGRVMKMARPVAEQNEMMPSGAPPDQMDEEAKVSTKKDGTYISSLEVAVTGIRKRSFYNISSRLYKDYQIVQDNQIIVNEKSYGDMSYYKINGGGRFILSSNY